MINSKFLVDGPTGYLEALIEGSDDAQWVGLLCHPHPLFGGSMNNKVITFAAKAIQASKGLSVKFNFRGVGKSQGYYDKGIGELEDAKAVWDWIQQNYPKHKKILVGFSFGAYIAHSLSSKIQLDLLTLIAPAVTRFNFNNVESKVPWLVIQGEKDEVVDFSQVEFWKNQFSTKPSWLVVHKAGHFFHGRLPELKVAIENFIQNAD